MRRALLATSLLLASCNTQLHQTRTENEIKAALDMADKAMNVTQKIGEGAPDADMRTMLEEVMTAGIALLDATRSHRSAATTDAVGRIDAFAAADVIACAQSSVIETLDLERMPEPMRSRWAMDVNKCAARADSALRVVSSKEAIEEIGFAVNMVYPVALIAHAKAGLKTLPLVDAYRSANDTLIKRLAPECSSAQAAHLTSCEVALAVQAKLDSWPRAMAAALAREGN